MSNAINILFDGPPGPEAGRFVEVENDQRESIHVGEWIERKDGYWVLRITKLPESEVVTPSAITETEWRDVYYLYRALHDGLCPKCGHEDELIAKSHGCLRCGFQMSEKQVATILAKSKDILKRRLTSFDRVGKALEV